MIVDEQAYLEQLATAVAEKVLAQLNPPPDDRPLIGIKELGRRLGISEKSARDLVNGRDGRPPKIASFKVGPSEGSRVVAPADLDEYIADRREAGR